MGKELSHLLISEIVFIDPEFIGKASDPDQSPPEIIDHLQPIVYICYHVAYIFLQQIGKKRSTLPAFEVIDFSCPFMVFEV